LINNIKNGVLSLFFPTPCASCGRYIKDFTYLYVCPECYGKTQKLEGHLCSVCMKPLQAGYLNRCGDCEREKRHFTCVAPAGVYQGAIKELIHRLKFYNRKKIAALLAEFILENVMDSAVRWADVIVPVPLSKKVLGERGYNQTALIGKILADRYGIEFSEPVRKARETEPQNKLERKERLTNLKGAYKMEEGVSVSGKKVLVVDDVYTTGTTLNEMAIVLIESGAKEVRGIMAARSV
jgi:competence protein ComFC